MRIELGNISPVERVGNTVRRANGPAVTEINVLDVKNEDGTYTAGYIRGTSPRAIANHDERYPGIMGRMAGNEVIANVSAMWRLVSDANPAWVSVTPGERPPEDAADLQEFFAQFFSCQSGKPPNVEQTYYTQYGNKVYPPGTRPQEDQA